MLPVDIFSYLSKKVLGQDDVLKQVAVSVYKHINGVKWGNILLIGNSGTGKTTIMNAVLQFYRDHADLDKFQAMSVMNANTLVDEAGEVNLFRIFKDIEAGVRSRLGPAVTPEELKAHIENATVCLDEIDKISATTAGRTNVTGISIQQALLTLLEGEIFSVETSVVREGKVRRVRIPLDTSRMLFICGGAFEALYSQVYSLAESGKDGRRLKTTYVWDEEKERPERTIRFSLKDYIKLDDLFNYGMIPQFISRFSSISVLENLQKDTLRHILLNAADSPYTNAKIYFKTLGIDLEISEDALEMVSAHAEANTRIGARALRDVFNRIMASFQFDPFGSGTLVKKDGRLVLALDRAALEHYLRPDS